MDNLLSQDSRRAIAQRLRFTAERLEQGLITPDSFQLDAEWIDARPYRSGETRKTLSGRVLLSLNYWATPIADLPE
jgi:hypothetical protein